MMLSMIILMSIVCQLTYAAGPPICAHIREPWIYATGMANKKTIRIQFPKNLRSSLPGVTTAANLDCKASSQQISSAFVITTNIGDTTTFVVHDMEQGKSFDVTYEAPVPGDDVLPGTYFANKGKIIGCHGQDCYELDFGNKQFKKMATGLSVTYVHPISLEIDGTTCLLDRSNNQQSKVECVSSDNSWQPNTTLAELFPSDTTLSTWIVFNKTLYTCGADSCKEYTMPIDKDNVKEIKRFGDKTLVSRPILFEHSDKLFMVGMFAVDGPNPWNVASDKIGKPFLLSVKDESDGPVIFKGPFCKDGLFVILPCRGLRKYGVTKEPDYIDTVLKDIVGKPDQLKCEDINEPRYYGVNLQTKSLEEIIFKFQRESNLPGTSGRHTKGIKTTATSIGKYVITNVDHPNNINLIAHDVTKGRHMPFDIDDNIGGSHVTCGGKMITYSEDSKTFYEIHPKLLKRIEIATSTLARTTPAIVVIGNSICLIGGSDTEALSTECLIDCSATSQVVTRDTLQVKGTRCNAVMFNGKLVVCGAWRDQAGEYYCEKFSVESNDGPCLDLDDTNNCAIWANAGECSKNVSCMKDNCIKTCGLCGAVEFTSDLDPTNMLIGIAGNVLEHTITTTIPKVYVYGETMHIVGQATTSQQPQQQLAFMSVVTRSFTVDVKTINLTPAIDSPSHISVIMPCPTDSTGPEFTAFDAKVFLFLVVPQRLPVDRVVDHN